MIEPKFYVPSEEFKKVLNEYALGSHKAFRDTINSRLLDICIKAYQNTKRALWPAIEARFGVIAYKVGRFIKKTQTFKRFKKAKMQFGNENTLAFNLVQARYYKKHGKHMKKADASRAATKLVNAVKRSIGFIASGWIPAMITLTVNKSASTGETTKLNADKLNREVRGQWKGFGRPALRIFNPSAEAGNTTKAAEPITGPAVREAFAASQANMERILKRNLEEAQKPFNGRVIK